MAVSDGHGATALRTLVIAALMSVLHGAMVLAMFPPWGAWWLSFIAIAPLAIVAHALSSTSAPPRRMVRWSALFVVFLVQLAVWLWVGRWAVDVSDAGWPAMGVFMASWPTLFVAVLARVRRHRVFGSWLGPLVAALLWGGIEAFRAIVVFDGYPWYLLAHPLIDATWLAQSAELWGVTPLSMLCAWSGAIVAECLLWLAGARSVPHAPHVPHWRSLAAAAGVWVLLAVGGAARIATLEITPGPVVVVVQTNVPSSNKVAWSAKQQTEDFARFRDLTIEALASARSRSLNPQVVIWPETMLPGFGLEPDTIALQRSLRVFPADLFSSAIDQLVAEGGVPMLMGSNAFEGLRDEGTRWKWNSRFNSAYLVDGAPPHRRYDKMHLTPFGETMPYVRAFPRLQEALLDIGARGFTFDLNEGTEPVVFDLRDGTRAVTPICFEDTLSSLCRGLVDGPDGKRADLIINLSNDGWFGHSDDTREAHELAARWRAIETRVGVVRAANTGVSAIIDPAGRVLERLPPRQAGWIAAPTAISPVRTIFARVGDVGSWLAMIATGLLIARTLFRTARGATVIATLFVVATVMPCCSSPPTRGRSAPPPPQTPAPLGLDAPASQQSWSSRNLSVGPDASRSPGGDGPAQTIAPGIPVVSSGDVRQTAIELLQTAAKSRYPILVANSIEELTLDPKALRPVIRPSLVNPNRGVRFVAAMAVGKAHLDDMATLVQPLLMDPSESVRAAAIYALSKLGEPVDLSPLAEMVRSDDPEVRGNAIMVLGDLGNPSAIPLLRSTLGLGMTRVDPARRRITDLQLAEALAKLGEDSELEPIRAALFAPSEQSEIIALACQMVAQIRDGGSVATLKAVAYAGGTATRPPEIRLIAFVSLASLGAADPTVCADFARPYLSDPNPQLRSLAVRAVAGCGGQAALPLVESRLYDASPLVQIAAAGAILRLGVSGQVAASR